MTDLDPSAREALAAAYWKLREHGQTVRNTTTPTTGNGHYALGIEAAAQDIAELLGVAEHEIEPLTLTARLPITDNLDED